MLNLLFVITLFVFAFILNDQAFHIFVVSDYVSLIFIPSGVRIFSVLVFELSGAIGVFIGSLLISFFYLGQTDTELVVLSGFTASSTALIGRMVAMRLLKLDENFSNITLPDIFGICVIFSIISTLGHQALYHSAGLGTHFITDALTMFVGDISGALVFLMASRYVALVTKRF